MLSVGLDMSLLNGAGWRYLDEADGAFATAPVIEVYGADDQVPTQATLGVVRVGEAAEDQQDLVMLQLDDSFLPQYADDHVEISVTIDDEVRCLLQARRFNHANAPVFEASKHLISLLKVSMKIVLFLHLHDGTPIAAQFAFPKPLEWGDIRG